MLILLEIRTLGWFIWTRVAWNGIWQ